MAPPAVAGGALSCVGTSMNLAFLSAASLAFSPADAAAQSMPDMPGMETQPAGHSGMGHSAPATHSEQGDAMAAMSTAHLKTPMTWR